MKKEIKNDEDLRLFVLSPAYEGLCTYLKSMAKAVEGLPHATADQNMLLSALLREVRQLAESTPPAPLRPDQRYGNPAFRAFAEKLAKVCQPYLTELNVDVADELTTYILGSFGNETRIDYGTGHELHFLAFLACTKTAASPASLALLFNEYVKLSRWIIERYRLEPAGSHGVWGLDDHHHAIYVIGAHQMIGNPDGLMPHDSIDPHVIQRYADRYIYLQCISNVMATKKAFSFAEHSPMLAEIAKMDEWEHVARGLFRMWQGEVLGKVPVVQHLEFGRCLRFSRTCL